MLKTILTLFRAVIRPKPIVMYVVIRKGRYYTGDTEWTSDLDQAKRVERQYGLLLAEALDAMLVEDPA
jgi:hypothetical protein